MTAESGQELTSVKPPGSVHQIRATCGCRDVSVSAHLRAAVPVSIGCSVALNDAPRALTVRTMS
jgi:hypothetical protein